VDGESEFFRRANEKFAARKVLELSTRRARSFARDESSIDTRYERRTPFNRERIARNAFVRRVRLSTNRARRVPTTRMPLLARVDAVWCGSALRA